SLHPRPTCDDEPTTPTDHKKETYVASFGLRIPLRVIELTISPSSATPPLVKGYLVLYNLLSAAGWSYVLYLTLIHFLSPTVPASASIPSFIPTSLAPLYKRATSTFAAVGEPTFYVQSLAILEILHALLGFVRSPLTTTAMQVASRLYLVWYIAARFDSVSAFSFSASPYFRPSETLAYGERVQARASPFYGSMVLSWSVTEVIRYTFYASSLVGIEPRVLLWLRYTTFYVLYITGASSEAFVAFSTLPLRKPVEEWDAESLGRALLFCIWWPARSADPDDNVAAHLPVTRGITRHTKIFRYIQSFDPSHLQPEDFHDISHRKRATFTVVLDGQKLRPSFRIFYRGSATFPKGTHGYLYYSPSMTPDLSDGEIRFRVTQPGDPADTFEEGHDLLLPRGGRWKAVISQLFTSPLTVSARRLLIKENSTLKDYQVKPLPRKFPFSRYIHNLDPRHITSSDFHDISGLLYPRFYAGTVPENFQQIYYESTGGNPSVLIRFPSGTHGFLYYHRRTGIEEGQLRFRITKDANPTSFAEGKDLLFRKALPWYLPESRLRPNALGSLIPKDDGATKPESVPAEQLTRYDRPPAVYRAQNRVMTAFGQLFSISFSSYCSRFWIGYGGRRRMFLLYHPLIVYDGHTHQSIYDGGALCCFEPSPLPEDQGSIAVVLRLCKIISPITLKEHDQLPKNLDLRHVPKPPKIGELFERRASVLSVTLSFHNTPLVSLEPIVRVEAFTRTGNGALKVGCQYIWLWRGNIPSYQSTRSVDADEARGIPKYRRALRFVRSFDPSRLQPKDFYDISHRKRVTFMVVLDGQKLSPSFVIRYRGTATFPKGTQGYLYYSPSTTPDLSDGEIRFRVTQPGDPADTFKEGHDLLLPTGVRWRFPVTKIFAGRSRVSARRLLIKENSPLEGYQVKPLSHKIPMRWYIRALDPQRITSSDFHDISGLFYVKFFVENLEETPQKIVYEATGGSPFRQLCFPPGTHGFLYYHRQTGIEEGQVRFRITKDANPTSFAEGEDLLLRKGFPWYISGSRLRSSGLGSLIPKDDGAAKPEMVPAEHQDVTRYDRLPFVYRTQNRPMFAFGQLFSISFSSLCNHVWIGYGERRRRFRLRHPLFVPNEGRPQTIYDGIGLCCFEPSPLPKDQGSIAIVLRLCKIISPITLKERDQLPKNLDLEHIPKPPKTGELFQRHASIWSARSADPDDSVAAHLPVTRGITRHKKIFRYIQSFDPHHLEPEDFHDISHRERATYIVVLDGQKLRPSFWITYGGRVTFPKGTHGYLYYSPSTTPDLSDGAIRFRVTQPGDPKDTFKEGHDLLLPQGGRWKAIISRLFASPLTVSARRLLIKENSPLKDYQVKPLPRKLPSSRYIQNLDPRHITSSDFHDISGRYNPRYYAETATENPEEIYYEATGGIHSPIIHFPPGTHGFLYYHCQTGIEEGQVRFRITKDANPASFVEGKDLLFRTGLPWYLPGSRLRHKALGRLIPKDDGATKPESVPVEQQYATRYDRPPAAYRTRNLSVMAFGQLFSVSFSSSRNYFWIGYGGRRHMFVLYHPFLVHNRGRRHTVYDGIALCCFEPSPLPKDQGSIAVVLRLCKIISPITLKGRDQLPKNLDLRHIPKPPKTGELFERRASVWVHRPKPNTSNSRALEFLFRAQADSSEGGDEPYYIMLQRISTLEATIGAEMEGHSLGLKTSQTMTSFDGPQLVSVATYLEDSRSVCPQPSSTHRESLDCKGHTNYVIKSEFATPTCTGTRQLILISLLFSGRETSPTLRGVSQRNSHPCFVADSSTSRLSVTLSFHNTPLVSLEPIVRVEAFTRTGNGALKVGCQYIWLWRGNIPSYQSTRSEDADEARGIPKYRRALRFIRSFGPSRLQPKDFYDISHRKRVTFTVVLDGQKLSPSFVIRYRGTATFPKGTQGYLYYSPSTTPDLSDGEIRFRVTQPGDPADTFKEGHDLLLPTGVRWRFPVMRIFAGRSRVSARRLLIKENSPLEGYQVKPLSHKIPMRWYIRALDPQRITSSDFHDISGLFYVKFFVENFEETPQKIVYEATGGSPFRQLCFPPGTHGFLYYHLFCGGGGVGRVLCGWKSGGEEKEARVLTMALELALVVLDGCAELDSGRSMGLEHPALLLATGEWAGEVFGRLEKGVLIRGGGGAAEARLNKAAAGVVIKVSELSERWKRSMIDMAR
ncbi:hypothetical protein EW146_g6422, partial [Bondarzewia mesenterica]